MTAAQALLVLCGLISREDRTSYAASLEAAALAHHLRPTLLVALMRRESRCEANAENPVTGALGLMQIMPATAAHFLLGKRGAKLRLRKDTVLDPALNIMLGAKVLRRALDKCKGDVGQALAVYNGSRVCEANDFSAQVLAFERMTGQV